MRGVRVSRPYTYEDFIHELGQPGVQIMRVETRNLRDNVEVFGSMLKPGMWYPFTLGDNARHLAIKLAAGPSMLLGLERREDWTIEFDETIGLTAIKRQLGGNRETIYRIGVPEPQPTAERDHTDVVQDRMVDDAHLER